MTTAVERRRNPRATLKLPVTVMLQSRPVPGDLVDISSGGMLFTCRAEVELADSISVQMQILPDKQCVCEGSVVRVAGGRGFGVQFKAMNQDMKEFVGDLFQLRNELQDDFLSNVVNPMVVVRAAA